MLLYLRQIFSEYGNTAVVLPLIYDIRTIECVLMIYTKSFPENYKSLLHAYIIYNIMYTRHTHILTMYFIII